MIVERTDFVSVPVTDLERSTRFYEGTPDVGREFTEPHSAYIALRVPDVEETRSELEGNGVEFQGETLDTGFCHTAFFHDPGGNSLMLHRRYAPND